MHKSIAAARARLLVKNLQPSYPLDIQWLLGQISDKPVRVFNRDLPHEVSGLIHTRDSFEHVYILLNQNHSFTRRRFSLAHEASHMYLHMDAPIMLHFSSQDEDPIIKAEADTFAAEVLMPIFGMFELVNRCRNIYSLIQTAMTTYAVSLEAAA
jgi:Zn-dependent peptidase ImmA (M78 family)